MPATPTRPRLEQIRFTSSKTGTHNIDTYLESAEIGNRTLASLLADLFDEANNGDFRTDIFDFRSSNGVLQFRVGEFLDANTGWQDVDFRTLVGKDALTFPMATSYPSQSLFILGTKLYISNATIQYTSQSAFDAGEAANEVTELFDAASLTTAELTAAVNLAQGYAQDAEDATINNADFNALVARLTDIQNLANPAANLTALEAFGDSYTANPSSNAITGLNNIGNTATAVTGLTNLKDSATPLANLSNSSAEINRLGATQNIVDAVELLGDNQTRIDAIDALGDATTSAAIDRLNQTDTSSPNTPQDTTADYIDALGTATMVAKLVALHAALSDINALAARTTEISALGSRTTEIDALYAIRADIDAIGDTATLNDISTVAGISTSHVASINQDLGTTDSPTFDAITVDTIDPDPTNIGTPLTIAGNLIVSGTTTTVNSNTVNIGDSIITLNSDETGVPSQNAGFEVERGTSANVSFVWDEANDRFTTNSQDLAASAFIGPLTGNVTGNADTADAWATPRTVQLQGDVTGSALNVDGSANITINTSMASDSVDLGTHTTGNYVGAGATSGNGLSGSLSAEGGTFTVTSNATDANTPSTIVFRDASGDFAAGTITADGLTVDTSSTLSGISVNGAAGPALILNDTTDNAFARIHGNNKGRLVLESDPDNSQSDSKVEIEVDGNQVALFANGGDVSFYEDTGTTAKFFWDASAERLGIGTTNPSTALDVTGTITADGLNLGDNEKVQLGASNDLQIYHDGSNSFIADLGTGLLQLRTNGPRIELVGQSGSEYMARFEQDGPVKLFYDAVQKLATTSTGVDVTGTVTADTFSFANWTVTESGGSLYFATGGTNKMKLDASGNLDVVGSVNANATIS